MGAPVVHYEITGKDGPALREFYGSPFWLGLRPSTGTA